MVRLVGPKNLEQAVSGKLQSEIAKVLSLPEVKQRLNQLGFEPIGAPSDRFASYIRDEMTKAGQIIVDAKIKVE
jgi:tripartite-type tricarboxylate transporter receptor subunit TctC